MMALVLRGAEAEGLLDGPTLVGLYARAMQTMGVEAANRVFLGEGLAEADVEGAVRAIVEGEVVTRKETTRKKLDRAFGRRGGGRKRLVTAAIARDNPYGLPKKHAYSVIGWDGTYLTIRNPWGRAPTPTQKEARKLIGDGKKDPYESGVFKMSLDDFYEVFSTIAYEEGE